MSLPLARLAELGVTLPAPSAPLAAYAPAVRNGDLVFTAGQLPLVDGTMQLTGKVGTQVSPAQARELARTCAVNALAAIHSLVGLDSVVQVVKVVGFVASSPDFTDQSAVIDGASELLTDVFGQAGVHARSSVGVAVLPRDAAVEVELVVAIAAGRAL